MIDQMIGKPAITISAGSFKARATNMPKSAPMNPSAIAARMPPRCEPASARPMPPQIPAMSSRMRKSISVIRDSPSTLAADQGGDGREALEALAGDLRGHENRHRQQRAGDAPEPSPEEHAEKDRDGIEQHAAPDDHRRDQVSLDAGHDEVRERHEKCSLERKHGDGGQ